MNYIEHFLTPTSLYRKVNVCENVFWFISIFIHNYIFNYPLFEDHAHFYESYLSRYQTCHILNILFTYEIYSVTMFPCRTALKKNGTD